jgi:Family of unknown function (DUF6335)
MAKKTAPKRKTVAKARGARKPAAAAARRRPAARAKTAKRAKTARKAAPVKAARTVAGREKVKARGMVAKPVARKAATRKAATRRVVAKKAVAKKAVTKKAVVRKVVATQAVRKVVARKATTPAAPAAPAAPAKAPAAAPARKRPSLDRERRIVRESDLLPSPPSSLVPQRHASAASSGADELRVKLANHTSAGPELTAGDVDADWQTAETSGDGAPGGDNPTPDQDVVEEIGRALGVQYDDDEELRGGDEIADRDHDRWELDPASSEDFEDR